MTILERIKASGLSRKEWACIPLIALWLSACDLFFHIQTDTLEYYWEPQFFGQAFTIPFLFAAAAVMMFRTAATLGGGRPASAWISIVITTVMYAISGRVGPDHAVTYAWVLIALWIVRVAWRRDPRLIAVGLSIAAGGVLGEGALSAVGEFNYLHPDVLRVPWWLFGLYLHGSLAATDIVQRLRVIPPSTGTMAPEMKLAAGDSRNAAARPNSAG
jgi:hypothetical protein